MRYKVYMLTPSIYNPNPRYLTDEEAMTWVREEADQYVRQDGVRGAAPSKFIPRPGTGPIGEGGAPMRKRNRAKKELNDVDRQVRRYNLRVE